MADFMINQDTNFKHFCRICKKGFGCGRALGGHMRAHGIDGGQLDEDDPASDWEEKLAGGDAPPSNKRMYALRTNPNRLKSCRACENCGKEFLSWKSLLEHGKCGPEGAESPPSSPGSYGEEGVRRGCETTTWSKRKRTLRAEIGEFARSSSSLEEEDLANCLMMLSNSIVDPLTTEREESCASASKDEERRNPTPSLMDKQKGVITQKGVFECKACKKVFNSHQALGGHRASHKKVKGCFAARHDQLIINDEEEEFLSNPKPISSLQFDDQDWKRKSKVHECSICHRVFSSGQALGGHKRCHWITSNSQMDTKFQRPNFKKFSETVLDLNLPAKVDDLTGVRRDPKNPLSFEVSTEIYLHSSWIGVDAKQLQNNNGDENNINNDGNNNDIKNVINHDDTKINVDSEEEGKVKLAKLGDLKDMSASGGSSPWLQVGIGSTTDVELNPI